MKHNRKYQQEFSNDNMSNKNPCAQIFFLLATIFLVVELCSGYQFDQVHTEVVFSPYVKHPNTEGHFDPTANIYTPTEIEVMLEVITEKFSKFSTMGTGARNVSYVHDSTYYSSDEEVFVSRRAAKINQKSGQTKLTMLQGIRYFDHNPRMETELKLAIECAEKANSLFAGTVEGFLFSNYITTENFKHAEETLNLIRELKNSSAGHLKIGTRMDYDVLESYIQNNLTQNESDIVKAILRESKFVSSEVFALHRDTLKRVELAFEVASRGLLRIREQLREYHTKDDLEFIAEINWISKGNNTWNTVKNLQTYWQLGDQWARDNNFPIRYYMAFDRPNLGTEWSNSGWWKLTSNSKSFERTGYIEKISELSGIITPTPVGVNTTTSDNTSSSDTPMRTEVILGITLGAIGLFTLCLFVVILYLRVNTLQQKLSKQDIKEFKKGISEKAVTLQDAYSMNTSALTIPYEKSFEILKGQLKINHDKILGMGEFGCVFKAQIRCLQNEWKDVALIMAKDGCPRSAVKGILSEIKLLIYIGKHPNIVALMGAYTLELGKGIVYIVTELCGLGSLQGYLRYHQTLPQIIASNSNTKVVKSHPASLTEINDSCERIDFHQMVQWSLEIASGMEYLGTKNVVHADLATRNVLLSSDKTAKIADFGLSRRMYNYTNYVKTQQEPLPWRWMAIESLKMSVFSEKSDIWSYGVTLWEIFSLGDQPYPGLSWSTGFVNMLVDGLRLESPKYADLKLYQLMLNCWKMDADNRPNFTYIKRLIENYLDPGNKTSCAAAQLEDEDGYEETMC